ncbi:hypothetical protein QBC43DRAFT_225424 [Cladorrhinum sp. PSN259]|nr:hypothetical protein QBC43DRAFT_225424 [Cladorrhinum sp. PSN259]
MNPPCCICETEDTTWICTQCAGDAFCDGCWAQQRPHRPRAPVVAGVGPHVKVEPEVFDRLERVFDQNLTDEYQQLLHQRDIDTTWFGIEKDGDEPRLHHHNRLIDIMRDSHTGEFHERFPHLVSFVGQTGAGKSTVIKLLIGRAQAHTDNQHSYQHDPEFPVPVTGRIHDNVATTGDVHLYSDPATYSQLRPLLYADCEGLSGGEKAPLGIKCKEMYVSAKAKAKTNTHVARATKKLTKTKPLDWATSPESQKREYSVERLYPRILYTFSDVIVFVLREVRTFQSEVLPILIDWASSSIDKSVNQPNLPHIIVVLNASDSEQKWDPQGATEKLLRDYQNCINEVPKLKAIVESLKGIGKTISSTKDLLEFYYSSVTVIGIPTKGQYLAIDQQVGKLHCLIQQKCDESYNHKRSVRMLLNAEKLQQYVNSAYTHFSRHLDKPFDFIAEALCHNQVPKDFGGHILNVILSIYQVNGFDTEPSRAEWLLRSLSRPIACCVMLAAARDNRDGDYKILLHRVFADSIKEAFEEFRDKWLRCAFQTPDGHVCRNAKNSHDKGHQAKSGKIFSKGLYRPPFEPHRFNFEIWMAEINTHLDQLIEDLKRRLSIYGADVPEKDLVSSLHRDESQRFYHNGILDSDFKLRLISHVTCFVCMHNVPERVLRCGHALCKPCIQSFAVPTKGSMSGNGLKSMYMLKYCPLNPKSERWDTRPMRIRFKPEEAGVRVLCLDGGGIRGIVELAILQAIERELGNHVPVQDFFDLIVGTSTGGIIALGLGVKRWSVASCIKQFLHLSRQAFTPRRLGRFGSMVTHKSYNKTKPLELALKSAFGEDQILFGAGDDADKDLTEHEIKVVVTSTSATENRPVIMTNYNTAGADRGKLCSYQFLRSSHSNTELKVWEAARATSAAPLYFKSYVKPETGIAYTDGAIHYNCPVWIAHQERQFLWPSVSEWNPDILLSLGTGLGNINSNRKEEERRAKDMHKERQNTSGLRYLWRTAYGILDSQLNCEEVWDEYCTKSGLYTGLGNLPRHPDPKASERREFYRRQVRINVPLPGERPALDDVGKLAQLYDQVSNNIGSNSDIKEMAHRLVASSFYFEQSHRASISHYADAGVLTSHGTIRCRFDEGSNNVKGLGRILRNSLAPDFCPYFLLQEDYATDQETAVTFFIEPPVIDRMRDFGLFDFEQLIKVQSSSKSNTARLSLCIQPEGYPNFPDQHLSISGFPRQVLPQTVVMPTPTPVTARDDSETQHSSSASLGSVSVSSTSGSVRQRPSIKRQFGLLFRNGSATSISTGRTSCELVETIDHSDSAHSGLAKDMRSVTLTPGTEYLTHGQAGDGRASPLISPGRSGSARRQRRHSIQNLSARYRLSLDSSVEERGGKGQMRD